jgi:alanyl-tRNA synthetase
MYSANQIRQQFIDFFVKKHGHTFVPSSSVVPLDDPTLMFTNAGMNQFKDVFLGTGTRPYHRAVNSQKCIRVSGKHNDLEEVGRDTYHHTFFEMLGNWSFGDYYKAEAIRWAWELLTKEWGIDKSRLHATVFGGDQEYGLEPDDEAHRLWTKVTDIDPSHVHQFGKKDNFWMMGETGPCGPCSEIHIDRTLDKTGGRLVNAGDARVIEIWNLVFIQYNRDDAGKLTPLPAKHVDTGMGFERLTAVLQGKESNYDTDVFGPIIDEIGRLTGKKYGGKLDDLTDVAFRVIADHLRMLTFAITDGALPSNKGRGYVMRSVLRRAVRFGWQCFEERKPFIYRLVPALVAHMGNAFPELKTNPGRVAAVIEGEEADFLGTIGKGLSLFEDAAERALKQQNRIRGQDVFDLYTTHGFPPDLTRQMASERGLELDEESYDKLMEEHRTISTAESDAMRGAETAQVNIHFDTDDRLKWSSAEADAHYAGDVPLGPEVRALLLDQTCFCAEAGGQVGDKGAITSPTGEFQVEDTIKKGTNILHVGRYVRGRFEDRQLLHLKVSPEREFTRKNHTATHLLHWALRKLLGDHVEQRGSKVKPDEFTFDFSHVGPMTEAEKADVERLVNEKIYQALPVQWREIPIEEAKKLPGVRAFFGEKYGDVVRVVEIGDGFSREFCGGTHLDNTGQAGFFKITGEEAVGKGVRRLTCVTAREAVATVQRHEAILSEMAMHFRCKPEDLPNRLESLQEEIKKLQQQVKKGAATDLQGVADRLLAGAGNVRGTKIIVGEMPAGPEESMRQQVDRLRQKAGSAIVVIGWSEDSKVQLIAAVTDDLVKKGGHAGKLVGQVAQVVGGKGGGRPTMALAGGKEPAKLAEALELAKELATQMAQ